MTLRSPCFSNNNKFWLVFSKFSARREKSVILIISKSLCASSNQRIFAFWWFTLYKLSNPNLAHANKNIFINIVSILLIINSISSPVLLAWLEWKHNMKIYNRKSGYFPSTINVYYISWELSLRYILCFTVLFVYTYKAAFKLFCLLFLQEILKTYQ